MKLAASSAVAVCAPAQIFITRNRSEAFQMCRDLLLHQPDPVAKKLTRLFDRAEKAIMRESANRFLRARQLEEAVCYISWVRPSHFESQQLQRGAARLLHQAFGSPNWRSQVIDGLQSA